MICCSACARAGSTCRAGAARAREFLPQGQSDRVARAGAAQDRRSGRSALRAYRPEQSCARLRRANGCWSPWARRAGRAAGARRQARRRRARCRVAGGVRRDAGSDSTVRGRAQSAHRDAAAGRSLGAESHHARRLIGGRELLEYARTRNVTRLLVGPPRRVAASAALGHRQLLSASRDVDVLGNRRRADAARSARPISDDLSVASAGSEKQRWPRYLLAEAHRDRHGTLLVPVPHVRLGQSRHDLSVERPVTGLRRAPPGGARARLGVPRSTSCSCRRAIRSRSAMCSTC